MSVVRKARAVERIFTELEKEIGSFKLNTKLHCVAGCGFCCKKPDIEATVIEFLPLALHYFQNNLAEYILEFLKENPDPTCIIFREGSAAGSGFCGQYRYRGLICRLFGFSARKNKFGEAEFLTCKKIKESQPQNYIEAYLGVKNGIKIPGMASWYNKLLKVDFELASKYYPVNIAIRKAVETVLSYYSYRRKPNWKLNPDQINGSTPSPGVSQDLISGPQ